MNDVLLFALFYVVCSIAATTYNYLALEACMVHLGTLGELRGVYFGPLGELRGGLGDFGGPCRVWCGITAFI